MEIRVLFLGDVVGPAGLVALENHLRSLRAKHDVTAVVANVENLANGSGITRATVERALASGVDVATLGDHVWRKRDAPTILSNESRLIRPANFPAAAAGRGWTVVSLPAGPRLGVLNLIGRVFMKPAECPFAAADLALEALRRETSLIVADVHGEATSEKLALGRYLDGRVSLVAGTHTHVQTADECILPGGTAFISDTGMTGPHSGIIGRETEPVIKRFRTGMYYPFEVATGDVRISGVLATIDTQDGLARGIERVQVHIG